MRPLAQVHERAVLVHGGRWHRRSVSLGTRGQIIEDLHLEWLIPLCEEGAPFGRRELTSHECVICRDTRGHPGFDRRQVVRGQRSGKLEVVVEAIGDRRPDTELRAREEIEDRLRHDVCRRMTHRVEVAVGSGVQQFISRLLKHCGVRDLDQAEQFAAEKRPRLMLLGFAKVASSLLEEIERHAPALKQEIGVVDFNPETVHELRQRGIHVHYGDISHADSLRHAGIEHAEVILSTIPDHYLRGINNLRMVQMLRRLNPKAAIIATAETLKDAREVYAAGAAYVSVPRLEVADDLLKVLEQVRAGMSDETRRQLQEAVTQRHEVIP